MTTIHQEGQKAVTSALVELYTLDTTNIGGGEIFRFTPMSDQITNLPVKWQGQDYVPFPIEISGVGVSGDGSAPSKPELTVSNIHAWMMPSIINLGDIVGASLTRCRTFSRFLDGKPQADPDAHYPLDRYLVDQKKTHNKQFVSWTLIALIDRPDLYLPLRRVLKDDTQNNLYAPGVGMNKG